MIQMDFTYKDILGIVGNVGNLVYNIPQIILTFRRKSTKDISSTYLSLRFAIALLWLVYGLDPIDIWWIILNSVTMLSTAFVGYYKVRELCGKCREPKYTFSGELEPQYTFREEVPATVSSSEEASDYKVRNETTV
jgi:uncharacterized protein with PQ loop repeat